MSASRVTRAFAVLVLAAALCTSVQARPVQVPSGLYVGKVTGQAGDFAFENTVALEVFSGGTEVRGQIRVKFDTSVEFNGSTSVFCALFDADFGSNPIPVTRNGASGSVALAQSTADGKCSAKSEFDGPQVSTADIALVVDGSVMTGTITLPGDAPLVFEFRAAVGDEQPPTTTTIHVAGIEELIDGVALTRETALRLKELRACGPADIKPGERCSADVLDKDREPFVHLIELRFGEGALLEKDEELNRVVTAAALRGADGKLLCPSLAPMFPVFLAMRQASPNDPSAMNRLVGLLVAMDLDARS